MTARVWDFRVKILVQNNNNEKRGPFPNYSFKLINRPKLSYHWFENTFKATHSVSISFIRFMYKLQCWNHLKKSFKFLSFARNNDNTSPTYVPGSVFLKVFPHVFKFRGGDVETLVSINSSWLINRDFTKEAAGDCRNSIWPREIYG